MPTFSLSPFPFPLSPFPFLTDMTSSLYINTTESGSGKALMSLGIIELMLRKTTKVGFFRPIIQKPLHGTQDPDIDLIVNYFGLNQTYDESYGLFYKEANELIAHHENDELLSTIITKYKALEKKCDFILCESSDYLGEGSAFEFNLNREIAKNLGCPILILGNAAGRTLEDTINPVEISFDSFQDKKCQVIGIIINKVNPELMDDLKTALLNQYSTGDYLISVIPHQKKLSSPRVKDIVEQLEAEVLYGHRRLNSLVDNYVVTAMQVQHAITRMKENSLIITAGDRGDMIIGALQAHQSTNYPTLSAILLSTGLKPEPSIAKLIEGLPDPLPILSVKTDTYETAAQINHVDSSIHPDDQEKIALSIKTFDEYVNLSFLEEKIVSPKVTGITPKMFTYNLIQQAKSDRRHIVLPEANDPRILQAASVLLHQEIVDITLLGKKAKIEQTIQKYGIWLDINQVNVINPSESDRLEEYTQKLYQLRQHKGITEEAALDYMMDLSYFATMMIYMGEADGMVSGALHTTAHTIRPALQLIKTKPGFSIVSSVFFMCLEDRVLVYGDCAVNPNPNSEELAEIALSSADTASPWPESPEE